jgi:hypothetical protein
MPAGRTHFDHKTRFFVIPIDNMDDNSSQIPKWDEMSA